MRTLTLLVAATLLAAAANADTVRVAVSAAEVRSSPSNTASYVLMEAPENYPLEIIGDNEGFYRVSDYKGRKGWVDKNQVGHQRSVVVANDRVNVRKEPDTKSLIVAKAMEGVGFEVLAMGGSWLQVRHETGLTGWLHKSLVWGVD